MIGNQLSVVGASRYDALLFKSGNADFAALYDLIRAIYGRSSPELKRYVPAAAGEVDKTKKGWGKEEPQKPPEENVEK